MQDYTKMLLDSAEIIHKMMITKNKDMSLDDAKLTIASANTLAQTIKTAIQAEIISTKLVNTKGNLTQLIASTCDEN